MIERYIRLAFLSSSMHLLVVLNSSELMDTCSRSKSQEVRMETRQRRSFTDDYKRKRSIWWLRVAARSDRWPRTWPARFRVRRWWSYAGREPTAASRRPTTQATLPSADHAAESLVCSERTSAAHGARHFKKSIASLLGSEMRFRFIEDRRADYPVTSCAARSASRRPLLCLALARGEPTIRRQS